MADLQGEWERFLPPYQAGSSSRFARAFRGEAVCVTGAGGSIGSALVRALGSGNLRSLVLLEASEQGLFEIQRYIESTFPAMQCEYFLGSVNDRALLDEMLHRSRPGIVFHAAAFKHVALLEANPFAASQNNVLGTYTLARAALDHGISRLVFLSTDKAVNPHSIMGVSKRIGELIVLSLSCEGFRASAIRLGNVIGSAGSVVPLFLGQIASGRPMSITHLQASRYFLTEEEAVTAILAAGAAGCEGMVIIPELRAPVLIADLAGFLSGAMGASESPPQMVTGLKPGEKLSEELMAEDEKPIGNAAGALTLVRTGKLSVQRCEEAMRELASSIERRDRGRLVEILRDLVPEYVPSKLIEEYALSRSQGVR